MQPVTEALRPRDEADLAELIATHPNPLEPVGGGSKRTIGRPMHADLLDLSALRGIVDYQPDELILTARAATALEEIERTLRESGQRLAFEPPDLGQMLGMRGAQTLGGVLAANLSGSRRLVAGAARDHFLGFRAVTGRGERFKAGGKVVKNVTGYDLPKLLAGSWGTLAVLTEVTIKVVPAPEHERTILVPRDGPVAAAATLASALDSSHEVSCAAFHPAHGVALRLEGFTPSVESRTAGLLETLGRPDCIRLEGDDSRSFWQGMGGAAALASSPVVWRISVAPGSSLQVLHELAPEHYLIDWGGGLLWIGCPQTDAARVRGAVRSGHATLIKAPRSERAANDVFPPLPAPVAALNARIKAAFDPHARLNPGRMS